MVSEPDAGEVVIIRSRLEVAHLGAAVEVADGALEQDDSDEAECILSLTTLVVDICPADESHVGVEPVRTAGRRLLAVPARWERCRSGALGVVCDALPVDHDARLVADDQASCPGGQIMRSPGPNSSSCPSSMTTFMRPDMM